MFKIVHLSDLHFGTEIKHLVPAVQEEIRQLKPDLIVVSGDLTQRARTNQFKQARDFLNSLVSKVLCVPGNHDIALYNWVERFVYPFYNYKKWISDLTCARFIDEQVAILGVNSVTPYKPMGGYVTDEQLSRIKQFFHDDVGEQIRIVIMHHNLIRSERHKIINDADKIIAVLADCRVNLVLSGHIHFSYIERLKPNIIPYPMYAITAGTAISTRTIAPNAFNIIEIHKQHFDLSIRIFTHGQFIEESKVRYGFETSAK